MGVLEALRTAIGDGMEPKDLGILQVCVRGVIVFLSGLIMIRVGHKRFMSKMTPFDVVLGFMLASALARAINGSAPLLPTLVMGFVLVLLHRVLSALSFWSETFGKWVKGEPQVLAEHGRAIPAALRAHKISEKDLLEQARLQGRVEELGKIEKATLERSGKISVIPSKPSS